MYKGNAKIDGTYFSVGDNVQDKRPFKAHLDVGLVRTTTGNRVFGAMKGASDGGLHVPHSDKRFPGHHVVKAEIVTSKKGKVLDTAKATSSFDPKEHRQHIFGGHVQVYYDTLKAENAQKFNKQFRKWEIALKGQKFEDLYKKVHAAIRANPARPAPKAVANVRKIVKSETGYRIMENSKKKTWLKYVRLTHAERKERIQNKMNIIMQAAAQ